MNDAETQLEATDRVDLRAARSDSSERAGLAKARRQRFPGSYESSDRVGVGSGPTFRGIDPSIVDEVRDAHADEMVSSAADIGFWIAWHQAGGFEALECLGWHRTTIFRKLKRFRARFGQHPDAWDPARSSISAATQDALATLEWIERHENLVICGPSGTGKSHLLEALGHAAIDARNPLLTARIRQIERVPVPDGFDELMPPSLATALVDRLLHHAHVVQTTGESIRLQDATSGKGVKSLTK
jgi:hypothetical protein